MSTDTHDKAAAGIVENARKALELVAYQAAAVVSREIVRKKAGTVTLFAFDASEGLSEHSSPYDALVHVLEGEVDVTIAGTVHRVNAGELILMPAEKPHALKAVTRFKMALILIR